jgi:P4 family phage/plasmid primase-like protien
MVWAAEPEAGRKLDISLIKELTGGEQVTCRHLYGKPFSYTPTYKPIFVTNHRPQVKSEVFGAWRRLRFVPFLYRVPEDKKNPALAKQLLEEEGAKILGYMVQGAMDWYAAGKLPECGKILAATAELKESDDPLAEFFMEKCIINASLATKFDLAWRAWVSWNEEKGNRAYSGRNTFRAMLAERACFEMKKYAQSWTVQGLGMRAELIS